MKSRLLFLLLLPIFLCSISPVNAQSTAGSSTPPAASGQSDGFISNWLNMVSSTQAEQPHWVTPVATTTPRLEQEFRYDIFWQTNNEGITSENYGGAKGVELIPERHMEVILVAPPAYIVHNSTAKNGFGDWSFLVKYRFLAGNEEHGNYILTAFLQVVFPTGQYKNGSTKASINPTISYGKGFGKFDVQGTFGATLPAGNHATIGYTFPWNNAFQYHVMKKLWPEVELNYTYFHEGPNDGHKQLFVTPGIIFGRFHIHHRLGFTAGGGYQIAATHFHTNNHNGILTVRFPF